MPYLLLIATVDSVIHTFNLSCFRCRVVVIVQTVTHEIIEDIQKIIDDAATEAVQEERQMTVDREAGYIETIKASGCEVNELTADEIAALTEVMKPVHEKYRDVIGSDTLDKAYEIIDKYNK